jgi:hypothetical protein
MDKGEEVSTDENILIFSVSDEALEHATAVPHCPVWTFNYCTYNYYQCGPIGSRT